MISNEIRVSEKRTLKHVRYDSRSGLFYFGRKEVKVNAVSVSMRYQWVEDELFSPEEFLAKALGYLYRQRKEDCESRHRSLKQPEGFVLESLIRRDLSRGVMPNNDWVSIRKSCEASVRFVKFDG